MGTLSPSKNIYIFVSDTSCLSNLRISFRRVDIYLQLAIHKGAGLAVMANAEENYDQVRFKLRVV